MQHICGVHLIQKTLCTGGVFGDNRIGMVRTEAFDVLQRSIKIIDHPNGNNQIGILGVPLILAN